MYCRERGITRTASYVLPNTFYWGKGGKKEGKLTKKRRGQVVSNFIEKRGVREKVN